MTNESDEDIRKTTNNKATAKESRREAGEWNGLCKSKSWMNKWMRRSRFEFGDSGNKTRKQDDDDAGWRRIASLELVEVDALSVWEEEGERERAWREHQKRIGSTCSMMLQHLLRTGRHVARESGYEATWSTKDQRRRHVFVVWSDHLSWSIRIRFNSLKRVRECEATSAGWRQQRFAFECDQGAWITHKAADGELIELQIRSNSKMEDADCETNDGDDRTKGASFFSSGRNDEERVA